MRPLLVFYLLVFYIMIQLGWWAYLLIQLNTEVYTNKIELVKLREPESSAEKVMENALIKKLHERWGMVAGEGLVFLVLLILGITYTQRSFSKEFQLARQQKNFLLSVTHEFKSPLAAIKLNLQTIQKRELDRQRQENIIQRAIQETDRINNLVENALLAARIEAHNLEFQMEKFNLSECVNTTVQSRTGEFKAHSITTEIEDNIFIKGDDLAISSVVLNLLENAEKYSPVDSGIKVVLKKIKHQAMLCIADNGIGIRDKEKVKVFEKFYRSGNEETRRTKGTGLGLYLVKYIADQHHAHIEIRDNKPVGTLFEVKFPLI